MDALYKRQAAWWACALLGALSAGCSLDMSGLACTDDLDCAGGERCFDRSCREVCGADDPCRYAGATCDPALGWCVTGCVSDRDCAAAERCAAGGRCAPVGDGCVVDADCGARDRCEGSRCVPRELDVCDPSACPGAEHGRPTCVAGGCALACDPGYRPCASGCCPADAAACGDGVCGDGEACGACVLDCGLCDGADFVVDEVHPDRGAESGTARIALDAAGRPHVVYLLADGIRMFYARWSGAGFEAQQVAARGREPALALDPTGTPGILDGRDGLVLYRPEGGGWTPRTVHSYSSYLYDLAFDAAGRAHYVWARDARLYYGLREGRVLEPELVESRSGGPFSGSGSYGAVRVALDPSSGAPHLLATTEEAVRYFVGAPTQWSEGRDLLEVTRGRALDLAWGPRGPVAIASDGRSARLLWLRDETSTEIDTGELGTVALDVDSAGHVHAVVAHDGRTVYHRVTPDGSSRVTLPGSEERDHWPDVAVDALGRPHVLFRRGGPHRVAYAHLPGAP